MEQVRISHAAVAHPKQRVTQEEAARHIGRLVSSERLNAVTRPLARVGGYGRRIRGLARGTCIDQRAIVLPPESLGRLGSIEARNDLYREHAGNLAMAATAGLPAHRVRAARMLATSSCTGYALPGWGADLASDLLPCDAARLPITESGCAGGVVALARAADYLRTRPGTALAVACELCSLAFHAGGDDGNLTASLIFGDGAGAALLETGPGAGLEVVESASMLIPDTRDDLGFALTDQGFYPILRRELVGLLPSAVEQATCRLLRPQGLELGDISAWLVHPGGARILRALGGRIGIGPEGMPWSWDSLREFGNTSSAAIFDVLRRYLADDRPPEWGIVAAFGPGVSIELLLVRREC